MKMKMDVSVLRQQFRQRRSREVLLVPGTASDRMSHAVSVVPVAQGPTSPWQPNSPSPPVGGLGPKMFDPWHVHLDLHRRSRLPVQCPPSSLETKTSRASGSSSEVFSRSRQEGPSPSGPPCTSRDTSSSDPLRAGPGSRSSEGCREDQVQGSHHSSSRRSTESGPTSPHQNQDQSAETSKSGRLLNPRMDPSSQTHYPFPSRKTPKISEAARRLGLYLSS